ncbi:MAG TPA: hypothetical protein VF152_11140 [Acidimicrobiia bacterium]
MKARASTTVVALVGERAPEVAAQLGGAANVVAVLVDAEASPFDRAVQVWNRVAGTHAPYLVHDADPLAAVADAWTRLYDGAGAVGELEVATQETLARWRAGSIELPDYYVVLDAEGWAPTRRHWFLGVLHGAAPARIVPVGATASEVAGALGRLAAGRWWPELDELLAGIDRAVPDRAGLALS